MKVKCLIVDDEELAIKVLEKFINTFPMLELIGTCDNALETITFLHNTEVDLLFLDINMPELSGLDMLKTLSNPPKVILTTAYSEYALESYEYGIVDYLLKPIKLERFVKAVNKVVEIMQVKSTKTDEEKTVNKTLFVKVDNTSYQLNYADILYVEAYGNYLKIHTANKTYITRETMQNVENEMAGSVFVRAHKSFIVNVSSIEKITGNVIYLSGKEIPIGTSYKNELLKHIKK